MRWLIGDLLGYSWVIHGLPSGKLTVCYWETSQTFGSEKWQASSDVATARLRVGTAVASPNPSKAGDRGSVGVRIYSGFIVDLPIENDDLMGFYWVTLWLCQHSHGIDGPFIVDLPSYNMVIFHSYVKLPEGISRYSCFFFKINICHILLIWSDLCLQQIDTVLISSCKWMNPTRLTNKTNSLSLYVGWWYLSYLKTDDAHKLSRWFQILQCNSKLIAYVHCLSTFRWWWVTTCGSCAIKMRIHFSQTTITNNKTESLTDSQFEFINNGGSGSLDQCWDNFLCMIPSSLKHGKAGKAGSGFCLFAKMIHMEGLMAYTYIYIHI